MASSLHRFRSFAPGRRKPGTHPTLQYRLSLFWRSLSYPSAPPPFSGCEISALGGVPHPPNATRQSAGEPSPSSPPWTVARHCPHPLLLSTGWWFLLLTPWQFFRCCLRITEVIACTSPRSRPGMISSCTELPGAEWHVYGLIPQRVKTACICCMQKMKHLLSRKQGLLYHRPLRCPEHRFFPCHWM